MHENSLSQEDLTKQLSFGQSSNQHISPRRNENEVPIINQASRAGGDGTNRYETQVTADDQSKHNEGRYQVSLLRDEEEKINSS